MHITRIWTHLPDSNQQKSELFELSESHLQIQNKITRYDFGGFVGDLLEGLNGFTEWKCWEVLKRVKTNGQIIETLQSVPEDWVPFKLISCETYPVKLNESGYEFAGWLVKDSEKGGAPSQEPEPKGSQAGPELQAVAVLPREQVRRPKEAAREHILQMGLQHSCQKKKHTIGKKANQQSQHSQQTSSNQTSRGQQREQYPKQWEEPVAQTWTPLSQIVQDSGVASRPPQHMLKQDPSYRHQKDSRSYLPSQLPRHQSSKAHRNPTSHQPNTPL